MAYSLIPGREKSALTPSLKRIMMISVVVVVLLVVIVAVFEWMASENRAEVESLERQSQTLTLQIEQMKEKMRDTGSVKGAVSEMSSANTLGSDEVREIFDVIPDTVTLRTFGMEEERIEMTGVSREAVSRNSAMIQALQSRYELEHFHVEKDAQGGFRFECRFSRREDVR